MNSRVISQFAQNEVKLLFHPVFWGTKGNTHVYGALGIFDVEILNSFLYKKREDGRALQFSMM